MDIYQCLVYRDFEVTTKAYSFIRFWYRNDWRCPLAMGDLFDDAFSLQTVEFLFYRPRRAYGTVLAFRNLAFAVGSTFNSAQKDFMVPSSFPKMSPYLSRRYSRLPSECLLRACTSLQFNWMYFNQSLPRRLGPFPATTVSTKSQACWLCWTRADISPTTGRRSPEYVLSRTSEFLKLDSSLAGQTFRGGRERLARETS